MSMMRRAAVAAALAVVSLVAAPTGASAAEFGLVPDGFSADSFQADGVTPDTQAGARPFQATTRFAINWDDPEQSRISGYMRNTQVKLPHGFIGNPEAATKCPRTDFDSLISSNGLCPAASQVGVATVTYKLNFPDEPVKTETYPVFNVQPKHGETADFGFIVATVPVHIVASVDPSDGYRVRADSTDISQGVPVQGAEVTLWGVPGDPAHDSQRSCGATLLDSNSCELLGLLGMTWEKKAFLTNPSNCAGPGESSIAVDSWENPGVWSTDSYEAATPTGCDLLEFAPTVDIAPSTSQPDSPSGLDVDLRFPQNEDPYGLATPPLRDARVTLPEGMTINPASADGLQACGDAQLGLGADSEVTCPAGSKIGSVTAVSPALKDPLEGAVYLRPPASDDPASGAMFRLALVVENPERGVRVKLAGAVRVDPATGRIVTEFLNNPQLPVSRIRLSLKTGPRAPLATPSTCGTKTADVWLSSWGGQVANLQSSFDIACTPGLGGFAPAFEAGTLSPVAGATSPFALRVSKPDGQSDIRGVDLALPKGLLATLKGNLGKQVGTARIGAGPGSNPFWLSGPVVLEGPYGDAPFSLRVTVPAIAGPFDLGDVVVRQRIYVDPETARVRVVSDPLPTIVKGVPVRLQNLAVDVDRPSFTINPTSCRAMEVSGTLHASTGQTAAVSDRFQVGDCAALGFKPKLAMRLVGRRQMRSGGHPVLRAVLTQGGGQANVRKAKVTLPRNVVLDSTNSADPKLLCGYDAALKADCPASTVIGKASLVTPILNRKLSGPVHLVQGIRFENGNRIRGLPTLLVKLRGEVSINLRSKTAVDSKDRLVSIFPSVPDARAGKFSLQINGGRKGILVVTENRRGRINLCNSKQTALVKTDGHNGKRADYPVRVKTACAQQKRPRR